MRTTRHQHHAHPTAHPRLRLDTVNMFSFVTTRAPRATRPNAAGGQAAEAAHMPPATCISPSFHHGQTVKFINFDNARAERKNKWSG